MGWKGLWPIATVSLILKAFPVWNGRCPTFDTKTYTEVILNMKIETKLAQDDLGKYQQLGDRKLLILDDLKLYSKRGDVMWPGEGGM